MTTLPAGIFTVIVMMYFAMHGVEISNFLNFHSFVIVIIGSTAALLLSAPTGSIIAMAKNVKMLFKRTTNHGAIHRHLLKLIDDRTLKSGMPLNELITYSEDLWEQGVDRDLFEELLEQRLEEMKARAEEPVTLLRNLAKYPPALGMMGTVMGMVSLFANLSSDNKDSVGANLALAMTATFYGLAMANLLITPLSDRLFVQYLSDVKHNETVFNMLIYINRNEPATIVESIDGEHSEPKAS